MGIPVVQGTDFTDSQVADAPQVIVVNEAFVRTYFPDRPVIGKRIRFGSFADTAGQWITIIGVVGDVRHEGLTNETRPYFYRPYSQTVWPGMSVVVRTAPGTPPPLPAVRKALRSVSPDEPVADPIPMREVVERSVWHLRFPLALMLAFGSIATALTLVGVFGVASQLLLQRSRELAIRSALGASGGAIQRLVLRQAMLPVLLGITAGLLIARASGQLVAGMLYGVQPTDLAAYVLAAVGLALLALAACIAPARRASRLDPMIVMRAD
jgi:hypothetical protein